MLEKKPYNTYLADESGTITAFSGKVVPSLPSAFYGYNEGMGGMEFLPSELPDDRIVLDDAQREVYSRIETFWLSRERYTRMGLSHKRSILLFGPPGTGKTTIARACIRSIIASGGLALTMCAWHELKAALTAIHYVEPISRPLLVYIEDIERYGDNLLDILDGSLPLSNTLFLSTTNNINKLSGRMKNRPSRIDEKILVNFPPVSTVNAYLSETLSDSIDDSLRTYISSLTKNLSMAHVKELVLQATIYSASRSKLRSMAATFRRECAANAREYSPKEDD